MVMLAFAGMTVALPVDSLRTAAVAQHFWQRMGGKADAKLVATPLPWSNLRLYVCERGGYVIVPADDVARPVLGYSLSSPFSVEEMPPQLESWLAGYDHEIARAIALGYPSDKGWHAEGGAQKQKSAPYGAVGPLLTTQWDQGAPYNGQCPAGTPVGCAATMQAQIMKYWNHPAFGEGHHGYNSSSYGYLSADFGHTLYEWDLMPTMARTTDPAAMRKAVATLFFHIGVSVNMDYNRSGSGAQGFAGFDGAISTDNALYHFFHYKNTLEVKFRNQYADSTYTAIILEELSHRRPVAFQGVDMAVGGHAFVCDGNDTTGLLHFNFGWSGTGDGYYAIGAINPGIGAQGQLGDYRFNNDVGIIIKIEPDYAMRVSDTVVSMDRAAGADSVIFCIDETVDAGWSVVSDAAWLTVEEHPFDRAGWVPFRVSENTTGAERIGTLRFVQGDAVLEVRVVQSFIDSASMCPVTVVMESTRGSGWQNGAYLSLESASGYIYGTATLASGQRGEATILVPEGELRSVWHTGGGTDRNINYALRNQYGEEMLRVDYAFANGGTHAVPNPCGHVGIDEVGDVRSEVRVYPNPVCDYVEIESAEPVRRVTMRDAMGRVVYDGCSCHIAIGSWPAGIYLVQVVTDSGTAVRRLIKH